MKRSQMEMGEGGGNGENVYIYIISTRIQIIRSETKNY